jgi:hypothetical protein
MDYEKDMIEVVRMTWVSKLGRNTYICGSRSYGRVRINLEVHVREYVNVLGGTRASDETGTIKEVMRLILEHG